MSFGDIGTVHRTSDEVFLFNTNLVTFQDISSVISGLKYIRTCLKETLTERYKDYMSTDWFPKDDRWGSFKHVYMEPCWTRTVKGNLRHYHDSMDRLYEIFARFKDERRVLAEGIFLFIFCFLQHKCRNNFYKLRVIKLK